MIAETERRVTPVMRQYHEAKESFPDAILFFRLGDFYEMFHDDAVVASRALGLTLTSRNKGAADEVPMAGVPVHAAHNYVAKLLAQGFKIAICEQLADPQKCKGIVPRKVVRVVTPGLVTDEGQLDARRPNFLCALEEAGPGDRFAIALFDLSTGDLAAAAIEGKAALVAELVRADPAETLLAPALAELRAPLALCLRGALRDDAALEDGEIRPTLDEGVEAPLFADTARDHPPAAVRAAARVLRFAKHNLPDAVIPVRRVARLDASGAMRIDETAQTHLELVRGAEGGRQGSLLDAIDATVTASGARLLRRRLLAPLMDVASIRRRLDAVDLFVRHARARQELRAALERVRDLERLAVRASLGEAGPRELAALRESLVAVPTAAAAVASIPEAERAALGEGLGEERLDLLPELSALLGRALSEAPPTFAREGGVIREGFDAALDELRALRQRGAELMAALEGTMRAATGIGSLKVRFTRGFGWYVEVTKTHLDKVPASFERRQTLANAERYGCAELDELADKLMSAEERFADREALLFDELVERVAAQAEPLRKLAATLARWDVAAALAEIAHRHDYCRPEVDDGDRIELADARHPVVERAVARGAFVPNDTTLDLAGERLLVITGPNMAGKSTLMRQVALATILAQCGSFVPARRARVGVADRVLSRVGASDNLARGESTFMVEMRETAAILREATRRSLVILDEIGRGTSTYDGLAIAWAVAEHLHAAVRCRAMFATHYHPLIELGERHAGIANYSVSAREHAGSIVFLHRLAPGGVSKSYGIAVARLAGLPEPVLGRAAAILGGLERGEEVAGGPGARGSRASERQLDLFERPAEPAVAETVCEELRALDTDRLTPLEALAHLAAVKRRLTTPS